MKKLIGYIIGILTIFMVFAMIYIVGAIYDTGNRISIEPYFFRTGLNASNQTSMPRSLKEVGERRVRDWLIQKYVKEYFYVVPDVENVARRIRGKDAIIRRMSAPDVMTRWEHEFVPDIRELASNGVMRTVRVFDEIFKPVDSDYWHVDYELKTWYKPNDMNTAPTITRGTMYIKIQESDRLGQLYSNIDSVQAALIDGIDPALVFVFHVLDVKFDRE